MESTEKILKQLREEGYEQERIPTWNSKENENFKPGSYIKGVLVEKEENVGPNNSWLYTIEEEGTNRKVGVWGSTILDTRLKDKPPGTELAIVYKGKSKSKKRKGATYKDYTIVYKNRPEDEDIMDFD